MLNTIIGYVVTAALSWLAGWISKIVHQQIQDKQTEAAAKESVQPLKDAKTGDEVDAGIDKSLGGF